MLSGLSNILGGGHTLKFVLSFSGVVSHHKSYDIGMMGFSVFVHAFPVNTNHLSPQPGPKARFSDTVTLSFFKFLAKTRK